MNSHIVVACLTNPELYSFSLSFLVIISIYIQSNCDITLPFSYIQLFNFVYTQTLWIVTLVVAREIWSPEVQCNVYQEIFLLFSQFIPA